MISLHLSTLLRRSLSRRYMKQVLAEGLGYNALHSKN